jgi:hypothetical protein
MTDLKERLTEIDDLETPDEWATIQRRAPRSDGAFESSGGAAAGPLTLPRRIGVIALALAISIGGWGILARAFRTTPRPAAPPAQTVAQTVREIALHPGIGHMSFAFGSIWVVESSGVARVDPGTGDVLAQIPVAGITARGAGGAPDWSGITSGNGLVWVTAEPRIVGIDPATNEVSTTISEESGVANITFADGLIVVGGSAEGNGDVRLLDPRTKDYAQGGGVANLDAYPAVLATDDWYWSGGEQSNAPHAALTRMSKDGSTHQVIAGVTKFDAFAEAQGSVWVAGGNSLYQVNEAYGGPPPSPQSVFPERETDAVEAVFPIAGPGRVASDGSTLWLLERVPDGTVSLTRLDPATGDPIGQPIPIQHRGPVELTVANGEPWVSFREDGALVTLGD